MGFHVNKNYFHLIMKQRYYIVYILLWIIMGYWFYRVVSESKPTAHAEETFAVNNFSTFEIGKPYYIIESYETLLALTYDKDIEEVVLAPYPIDNELQQWIPVREGVQDLRSATHTHCATAVLQPGVQYGTSFLLKNKAHPVYLNVYYDTTRRMIGYNVFELYTITTNNRVVDNLDSPIFSTEPVVDRSKCTKLGHSTAAANVQPRCTSDGKKRDIIGRRCSKYGEKAPYMKAEAKSEGQWHNLNCDGGRIAMGAWWFGSPYQKYKRVCSGGWACGRPPRMCGQSCTDYLDGYGNWWTQQLWPGGCDRDDPNGVIDCRWTGIGGDRAGPIPLAWWPTATRNACAGASSCSFPATSAEWHNNPTGDVNTSEVHYKCVGTPSGACEKWEDVFSAEYCNKCKLFTGNYNKVTCTDTTNNIRDAQKFKFENNELQLVDKLTTTGNTALNSAEKQYVSLTSEDKLTLTGGESAVFYFIPPASRAVLYAQYIIKNQKMPANIPLEQRINEDVRGSLQTS